MSVVMRSRVLGNRIRLLQKACSLGVLGIAIAGCSSGFQRFDDNFYQSAVPQAQNQAANNEYPGAQGDLDTITTASVRSPQSRVTPLSNVAPPQYPAGINHAPEPTYVAPQASYNPPQAYRPPAAAQTANGQSVSSGRSPSWQSSSISGTKLSGPSAPQQSYAAPAYTPPKPEVQSKSVYIPPSASGTDNVTTASVRQPAVQSVAKVSASNAGASKEGGWSSVGATTITAREGETLYNLSKRYGVPVSAIVKANGLKDASSLQAGQKVLIPNYIFSASSPVSAPDNNPKTRHARATTGYLGEASLNNVAVPEKRPYKVASVNPSQVTNDVSKTVSAERFGPAKAATPPAAEKTPEKVKPSNVASVDTSAKAPERSGISSFRWPVKGRVVSGFGDTADSGKNEGLDISVPEGTAVKAAENGVVIYAGSEISSYGNLILIRHADDWVSAYAHNKDFNVSKGDRVNRGQTIARSGKTGSADRPKLHFELRKNSKPVDPKKYLAG